MQPYPDSDIEIIDDFEAVRLLINIYLIKKNKCSTKPVDQEKFIENVCKELRSRGYHYLRKKIVYTWKWLLENYEHYKKYFSNEKALNSWPYFSLMDNCFDESKQSTSEKFVDRNWTFFLIESLKKHKPVVLHRGLTMDILQALEDDFHKAGNHNINQKDIYNQWVFLKRFYVQNNKSGCYKQKSKSNEYFQALNEFFESDEILDSSEGKLINISENELSSAAESIVEDETRPVKRQKINSKPRLKSQQNLIEDVQESATPFTVVMHDILLQCCKKNKSKMQNTGGSMDDVIKEACEELKKLGYDVTRESVANEWNDLSCRFDLIKSTEHPEKWPYYSDMSDIYDSVDERANETDDQDNQSTIGSIIVDSLKKDKNLNSHGYAKLTERLLNIYEANSKEFLEIKDIMLERNLLSEETNYLLEQFINKCSKKGF